MRLLVESCAGLAALSRWTVGAGCPPFSRPGNKWAYAEEIAEVCGFGVGDFDGYAWAEPDPVCAAMLRSYTSTRTLDAAASLVLSWRGKDPEQLWHGLKAQGPIRGNDAAEVARWAVLMAWSRCKPTGRLTDLGYMGPRDDHSALSLVALAARLSPRRWPRIVRLYQRAHEIPPVANAVCYIDGTYEGTTQYAENVTRADAVALARRWDEAGAHVVISEAEPIADLGWHTHQLQVPANRAWSTPEWLTSNRPLRARQEVLFG